MPNNDKSPFRVYRGGSCCLAPANAQVVICGRNAPGNRFNGILGVRIIRLVTPMQQIAEMTNAK